jgi:hypothetical protein
MNEHGRHAMETMKNHDPENFAQIADPETHFSTLGEEIQQAIWDLSEQLTPTRVLRDICPESGAKELPQIAAPYLR